MHVEQLQTRTEILASPLSLRVVSALADGVERMGGSRAEFLHAARLEPAQLRSHEVIVPRAEMYRLCEVALDLTGDPAFGLHWADVCDNAFNPLSHLIVHAPTLRHGFQSMFQFNRLLSRAPSFEMIEDANEVTLMAAPLSAESARVHRLCTEMMLAAVFRIIQTFVPHARADVVSFEHHAPSYRAEYTRLFKDTVRFGQPFTGIVFDRSLMDAVSPHEDADVHAALRVIAERRALRLARQEPFALRVRDALVEQGCAQDRAMERVARELGMSSRSLRRRLVAEGTSYSSVLNEALAILAKQLLRDARHTIQDVSFAMGFANSSAFHRAFKRWTRMTPGEFREQ